MAQRILAPAAERLREDMAACPYLSQKAADMVEDFLQRKGIRSLSEVTLDEEIAYFRFASFHPFLSPRQQRYYGGALEAYMLWYLRPGYADLEREIQEYGRLPRPAFHKIYQFLMISGIHRLDEIDYAARMSYEKYLSECRIRKVGEHVKMLDWLKLEAIRKHEHPLRKERLAFEEQPLFLLYHPDYQTAMRFYFIQDKQDLVFDFSYSASLTLKKQIFSMLEASLELDMSNKAYREQYLVPLKMLYLYCVKEQVRDMEQMELHQAEGFRRYLEENAGGKADSYSQILGRMRKFLFLNPAKTNWNANVWYLDRFRLKGDRMNPARKVGSFHFYLIQDPENRRLFQLYMKYCIGISSRSMNRIRAEYYNIYLFLQYCDGKGIKAARLSPQEFEQYMTAEQDKPVLAATYNQRLEDINHFYLYLHSRGYVSKVPFMTGLYLKKAIPVHHDRSVPPEVQGEILAHLKDFPEELRLMYLHLWCAGLRVNEVCCLTGDAYSFRDGVAWLQVYQYKMKRQKTIPIPETLYRLMQDYIHKNHRLPHQYVFQGKDGQAYPAGTFCIQMKKICQEYGIRCGDYIFRSHDYRHSVATRLYDEGASLQAVRDFLGHLEEDMTKQYLDYIPQKINAANEKYFETNSLADKLQKRKEEMEWKTVSM